MARVTDKDGVWEVTEGNGCISKCLIEPSVEYLASHPTEPQSPTIEERLTSVEDVLMELLV